MRRLLRAYTELDTRAQESVSGVVLLAIGGGVLVASVTFAFGRGWEACAREGTFIAIMFGAIAGWRYYQQHARRLRTWFGVLWVLGALGAYVTTQTVFGEDPVVALMVAATAGPVGALFVVRDLRADVRARTHDPGPATTG